MSCNDNCAVDKAEAKEFAYFRGLAKGAQIEQERITRLFDDQKYRFGKAFVDEIIQIIKGAKQ